MKTQTHRLIAMQRIVTILLMLLALTSCGGDDAEEEPCDENSPPRVQSEQHTVVENGAISFILKASDVDGDPLSYVVTSPPTNGTITGSAPYLTYTPDSEFHGDDSLSFQVSDGMLESSLAVVQFVTTPESPPEALPQTYTFDEDTAQAIVLSGYDGDGDPLNYTVVSQPANGTLTGSAPYLSYLPDAYYHGTDSFTFLVNDGKADSAIATITLNINPVNNAPEASVQAVTLYEDTPTPLTLLASDVDGDPLNYIVVVPPAHGLLMGSAPDLTYVPFANYYGSDSFSFKVSDGLLESAVANVALTILAVDDVPTAADQSVELEQGSSVALLLTGYDVEGAPLSYTLQSSPGNGSLSGTAPNLSYTPNSGYNGSDSFTYSVNDGAQESAIATISLTVLPPNTPPLAVSQGYSLNEDSTLAITLGGSDPDGDPLTYQLLTTPANGALSGIAPDLSYTPFANYYGSDSFIYVVNDGRDSSQMATITFTINPVDDVPLAQSFSAELLQDSSVALLLSGADVEGAALSYAIQTGPANGSLSGSAPNLTYTPNGGYNGSDSFSYTVNDGVQDSAAATVSLTIYPPNDAPQATAQSLILNEDTPLAIILSGSDPDGDPLSYMLINTPSRGTLLGTPPNLSYTPAANFSGSDSFTFIANDGREDSLAATVSLTINPVDDAPVAFGFSHLLEQESSLALQLAGSDVEGAALSYAVVSGPAHGSLSGSVPNLSYTPNSGYTGSDSFSYKVNDGALDSVAASVNLTIHPPNNPPVAAAQALSLSEDSVLSITLSGSDSDGDPLSYNVVDRPSNGALLGIPPNLTFYPDANYQGNDSFSFTVHDGIDVSLPAIVTLNINAVNDAPQALSQAYSLDKNSVQLLTLEGSDIDGDPLTYSVLSQPAHGSLSGAAPNLSYTPHSDYIGSDSFTFLVNDGTVNSATATLSLTINSTNSAPVATAQNYILDEDTTRAVTLSGSDPEGDELNYYLMSAPSHGALSGFPPNLSYTPHADYNGSDSFTFMVYDGLVYSDTATISLTINPLSDTPIATAQSYSLDEDGSVAVTLTGSDGDGDPLSYSVVTLPLNGSLTGSAPDLLYTPAANYNGTDSFSFLVNDGTTDSLPATITLTINPVSDVPVADAQSLVLDEDSSQAITLTGSDGDGDPLSYIIVTEPLNGSLTGTAPNLTYTPVADYHGSDSFSFLVSDGSADSAEVTVTLTVNPLNDAPVVVDQSHILDEDGSQVITLSGSDVEGDPLSYIVATEPLFGILSGTAPDLIYTPDPNYHGIDSFTFVANDSFVDSAPATVTLTINSVNDLPIAFDQAVSLDEDSALAVTLSGLDVDYDPLTYSIVTGPLNGTLSGTIPDLIYIPVGDYSGTDSFSYVVNDTFADSAVATISLIINPVNDVPIANDLSVRVVMESSVAIALNGYDAEGSPLSYWVATAPAFGTLSGTPPNLIYTPMPAYEGSDSFFYYVNDGNSDSALASVFIAVVPPIVLQQPLNDTGITFAAEYPSGIGVDCLGYLVDQQDCSHGRDATHNNDSDGHAGFSFTKLDVNGNGLPATATSWSCVRDNVTGLIWEKKTTDAGLHDTAWTYSWYNSTGINDGGGVGYPNLGACGGTVLAGCDTQKFVAAVNAVGLCGASNWRLPTRMELINLMDFGASSPVIDTTYFPNTTSGYHWSSSPYAIDSITVEVVNFATGVALGGLRWDRFSARLVRDGL